MRSQLIVYIPLRVQKEDHQLYYNSNVGSPLPQHQASTRKKPKLLGNSTKEEIG